MKPRTPAKKYRFMLGTTSRVPGAPGWHYLLLDIDFSQNTNFPPPWSKLWTFNRKVQRTKNGIHIYTSEQMRLRPMLKYAIQLGADRTWARLALKRGWAFLADKGKVKIPWPVERAIIGWKKPK